MEQQSDILRSTTPTPSALNHNPTEFEQMSNIWEILNSHLKRKAVNMGNQ